MIDIIDFDNCTENGRMYGGKAGSKLGIIYNGENWILKFPKSTKGMRTKDISYTTSPLSEYLGSQIYKILGYDVHETKLGIKDEKLVVALKDFTESGFVFREFSEIKNYYNKRLEEILDETISETDDHGSCLSAIKIHLEYNPMLNKIKGASDRFWDCVIVDGLINNNDRNSSNWGIMTNEKGESKLAPIYDNGGSFSNKMSEIQIEKMLGDENRLFISSTSTTTGYVEDGKSISFFDMMQRNDPELIEALQRVVPKISVKMPEIKDLFASLPNSYKGISVISEGRKEFYLKGMEIRLKQILVPALERASEISKAKDTLNQGISKNIESAVSKVSNNTKEEIKIKSYEKSR